MVQLLREIGSAWTCKTRYQQDGLGRGKGARTITAVDGGTGRCEHSLCSDRRQRGAAWVATVDPGAARNTVGVNLMVNRADFDRVNAAMQAAGFAHYELMDVHMFLDGPNGRPRDAVHLLFAGEKVKQTYSKAAQELTTTTDHRSYKLLDLEPLKDRAHLRNVIEVGLVDQSWPSRLPPTMGARLQELLDDPNG